MFDWLWAGIVFGGQVAALAGGEAADRAAKRAARHVRKAAADTREAVVKARQCVGGHSPIEVLDKGSGDVLKYRCKRCGKVGWAG